MPRDLAEGLYEHVVSEELAQALEETALRSDQRSLDPADAPLTLSRHLAREIERALEAIPGKDRVIAQTELVNALLARLLELAPAAAQPELRVLLPPKRLESLYRSQPFPRPQTPLASSTLLTRSRSEPALGHELAREISSADRIDAVVAFVTMGGIRAIRDALESFSGRGTGERFRLLTTTFTGTTEPEALDALARLPGVSVKVSYDVRRTRLHAKAWLFHRDSGLHSAYVGSANLTSTALGSGHEWMVKVTAGDLPHVVDKFEGTFETLWNDPEFERYDPANAADRGRLAAALGSERTAQSEATPVLFRLRPFPFQEEILDRLAAERLVHCRRRNLVVAATGTGKTVIAAFDYKRQIGPDEIPPSLLFLAHRRELLEQARLTFRHVLGTGDFGELLVQGEEPKSWDHVFATIQSAESRELVKRLGPDHFSYVVLDEAHHAPARSYQAIVPCLQPRILLGLTATPERSDGKSLLPDFDHHVAAELRLWHALERQLLVPFEYYGVSDNTDLTRVRWSRASGYDAEELSNLYTGNEARVDLIVEQLRRRVRSVRECRALAFCVSVAHAEYMAEALSARGIPALAVHGGTPDAARRAAPDRLRERDVNVLCTCDLYNEGVDLPFVDALLMLRPTASASLFLQQLGRGLRQHERKETCLVLDFIGQHRSEFRFDATLAALSGVPRGQLRRAVVEGFPFLPSGCVMQLDVVARRRILAALQQAIAGAKQLTAEVRELAQGDSAYPLATYLEQTAREVEDVYEVGGWTTLLARAGVLDADDSARDLSRRLGSLLHVDEPVRLRAWPSAAAPPDTSELSQRRLAMLDFQLFHQGVLQDADQTVALFRAQPAVQRELTQLVAILEDRIPLPADVYPLQHWPIALHRHYRLREILAAVGYKRPGDKKATPQGGLLKLEPERRELLFVTLDKSDGTFSPTTRYRDYAISPTRFHWETQSIASVARESGRRYIESPGNGWSFHLFVRTDRANAYAYLGPVVYETHSGDRPIAITWKLEHPMPALLFERYATLVQG